MFVILKRRNGPMVEYSSTPKLSHKESPMDSLLQKQDFSTDEIELLTKQIAKGGGISFFGQLTGKFLNLLLQILLTRLLGSAEYGLYVLGFNILESTRKIFSLGLQDGVVRFGAMYQGIGDKASLKGTFISALSISFCSAIISGIVLFFMSDIIARNVFHEPNLLNPLRLFSLAAPFYTLLIVTAFSARALRRIDYEVAITQLSLPLITLLATGISFLLGYHIEGAVCGFFISTVISAGIGLYLLYRIFPSLISRIKPQCNLSMLLSYSIVMMPVSMSSFMLKRVDRFMLGIMSSVGDVGIYNAAATLAMQSDIILVSFSTFFTPTVASLFYRGHMNMLSILMKTTNKWIFTLTFPTVIVCIFFARPIMTFFGSEFSVGASVLIVLAIAELINSSVGLISSMLTMTGHQKIELFNCLTIGGLNVLLNFLFIPKYGALGAAIATGISIIIINLTRLFEVYFFYRLHPYKSSYWKPIIAGVMAISIWLCIKGIWFPTRWMWIAGIVIFGVSYILALLVLRLDEEDQMFLMVLRNIILKRLRLLKGGNQ